MTLPTNESGEPWLEIERGAGARDLRGRVARGLSWTMVDVWGRQLVNLVVFIALARLVQAGDEEINHLELDIENECLRIFALTHPVAGDLRFVMAVLRINNNLERIGDNVEYLVRAIGRTIADGVPFSERAMTEIDTLFEKVIELVECVRDAIGTENKVLMRHIIEEGGNCERLLNDFALFHQERLIEGLCSPKSSSVYLAILDYLKGIEEHVRQMARALLVSKQA